VVNWQDINKVTEDIKALQPTVFASVPRVFNRIYERVQAKVRSLYVSYLSLIPAQVNENKLRAFIFRLAFNAKRAQLHRGVRRRTIWDRLVFDRVAREALGAWLLSRRWDECGGVSRKMMGDL
jgi:long-chain acyl-CoA synthetase